MPLLHRLYVPVYTLTLILSAFLLFGVQPMFGKMILPMLGGSPQVWNTAMLFFQAMLLAGYAYAHVTSKFMGVRIQAALHLVLLLFFSTVLPIAIPEGSLPEGDENPLFWQMGVMFVVVGGPFFILAGSAPLFQRWFSQTHHPDAANPYFLYAASNLGSMTALLAYPFVMERFFTIPEQSTGWMYGYGLLIAMTALAALLPFRKQEKKKEEAIKADPPSWSRRLGWLVLAFLPSSLMLGVTSYITTDVAAFPLLWVIPLALYVGTFIIVFSETMNPSRDFVYKAHAMLLIGGIAFLIYDFFSLFKFVIISVHMLLFFASALLCHQELAARKPAAEHLTEFYFIMSLGGVLGGIFNALLAPFLFLVPLEYVLMLGAICWVRFSDQIEERISAFRRSKLFGFDVTVSLIAIVLCLLAVFLYRRESIGMSAALVTGMVLFLLKERRIAFAMTASAVLLLHPGNNWAFLAGIKHISRNFFGVTAIYDIEEERKSVRMMVHGTTIHGAQPLHEDYRLQPITYYNPEGPIGEVFRFLDERGGEQRIAVMGLGVGSQVCYPAPERHFDVYEIDPDVIEIAEDPDLFTYLSDCGSAYDMFLGDARLQLGRVESGIYDVIFMDAFTSDNVPVHLITVDALALYREKLKPEGIIVVNISNRFLNLIPVLNEAAAALDMEVAFRASPGGDLPDEGPSYASALYGVLAPKEGVLDPLMTGMGWTRYPDERMGRPWTDDYANPLGVLIFGEPPWFEEVKEQIEKREKEKEEQEQAEAEAEAEE